MAKSQVEDTLPSSRAWWASCIKVYGKKSLLKFMVEEDSMLMEVMQWNYGWVVVMTWRLKCVMAQDFGRLQ